MKCLKIFSILLVMASSGLSLASCKKDKQPVSVAFVTKDQLLGKWNMFTILPGGFNEKDEVNLKANGEM